ncbi:hypothetical protein BDP27DRAFT_1398806 [Rhodocollybia butyracea]|uniref:F-box domain-containing protein n=1 Tax=Rhodocollybia butyracea TaxID=206335 RepID=A0A9P5UDQ6_9AGAR|nr:hypothetical protein BDP27DRAFT_1398806 [Rhodocollybia butyracea]
MNAHSISILPDELLLEVFKECVASTAEDYLRTKDSSTGEVYTKALVISSVDRRWRSISIHAPVLWARIFIAFSTCLQFSVPSSTVHSSVEAIVTLYLERSRGHPLDVCLWSPLPSATDYFDAPTLPEDEDKPLPPVALLLLQESHRWRAALLELPFWNVNEPLTFPSLEELDARCTFGIESPHHLPLIRAPHLRKLKTKLLQDQNTEGFYTTLNLECGSLDKITLDCVTPEVAAQFLRRASAVCRASVNTLFESLDSTDVVSPVKALSITTVTDTGYGEDDPGCFLSYLTLPDLEELEFIVDESSEGSPQFPVDELMSLLRNRSESCSTKLTRLHMKRHCISETDILGVLELLPGLTEFVFEEPKSGDNVSPTEKFIKRLTGQSPTTLLPNISRVELILQSLSPSLVDTLLDFLESRRPQSRNGSIQNVTSLAVLEQAKITIRQTLTLQQGSPFLERIQELRVGGLALDIERLGSLPSITRTEYNNDGCRSM